MLSAVVTQDVPLVVVSILEDEHIKEPRQLALATRRDAHDVPYLHSSMFPVP